MTEEPKREDEPRKAEAAYEEYMRRVQAGEPVDFDAFRRERPELARALRLLHSLRMDSGDASTLAPGSAGMTEEGGEANTVFSPREILDAGAPPAAELKPGTRIGAYRLVSILGQGGFGVVYEAEQEEPIRRKVAVKVIRAGMDSRDVIARFEAERQALAYMDHPGIARIFDSGTTESARPYFAMEFVAGTPITAYCDRHSLDTLARLELFASVCDAVQHAHQKGIIHRDIKPSNALVTEVDGRPVPKIIDFGIAKATDRALTDGTLFTEAGQVIGTPAYMSPEQAGPSEEGLDTRTDIYSLGVLLYELLVGALPFGEETFRKANFYEVLKVIIEKEPAKPSSRLLELKERSEELARVRGSSSRLLTRRLRDDLDWIVMKAIAKERQRRYQSASEFAADVRRHLAHEPVLAGPPSAVYLIRKFLRKNRAAVLTVAVVCVVLVTAALTIWRFFENRAYETAVTASATRLREGRQSWEEFRRGRATERDLKRAWEGLKEAAPTWYPTWERQEELDAWKRYLARSTEVRTHHSTASIRLEEAHRRAPAGSPIEAESFRSLKEFLADSHRVAREENGIRMPPDHYERLLEQLGVTNTREFLRGEGSVSFVTEPPGAEVYCFRYYLEEQRWIPLPYDPERGREDVEEGFLSTPFLEIEQVDEDGDDGVGDVPFRPGDRLVSLNGVTVGSRTELARALAKVREDQEISVRVRRGEADLEDRER